MGIFGIGTKTYLYLNGIAAKHELQLAENISLVPVNQALPINTVSTLLSSDVDFALSILCAQGIASQLRITAKDAESLAVAAWNSQWDCILLGALLNCNVMCNIQCDKCVEELDASAHLNITNYAMHALLGEPYILTDEDEAWIMQHYSDASTLMSNDVYRTAVHSMATYHWHTMPRVQLAIVWAGIEALFDVSTELSFRISLYAATFLSDKDRASAKALFSSIKKLYSARSSAVHGGKIKGNEADLVKQSAQLLHSLIRKCAEINSLPDIDVILFD